MKKILYIDSIRDLKPQWKRFLFLVILLTMGMGLYLSGRTGELLLQEQLYNVYHNQQRSDMEIQSVLGFTLEQQRNLAEAFPSLEIEGAWEDFGTVNRWVVKLHAYELSGQLNRPVIIQGREIQEPWEVMVSPELLTVHAIGDWISIHGLEGEEFQIVGTAVSPLYLSSDYGISSLGNGQVEGLVFLSLEEGNRSHLYLSTGNPWNISVQASDIPFQENPVRLEVQQWGELMWAEQVPSLMRDKQEEITNLSLELAQEEEKQTQWNASMLEEKRAWETEISEVWAEYEKESGWRSESQNQQVREDIAYLEALYQQSLGYWQAMEQDGELILSDLRKEIGQAQRDLVLLEEGQWSYHSWEENLSYVRYLEEAQQLGRVGQAFPMVCYGVCLLLCWAIVSQMIQEQKKRIATLCSLGYGMREIIGKYLLFVLLALLLGSFGAFLLGFLWIPKGILQLWGEMFYLGEGLWVSTVSTGLLENFGKIYVTAVSVAGFVLLSAVVWTCAMVVQKMPAVLYRPMSARKSGQIWMEKIDILWHDLSFEEKITLRNVFRNPKRSWGSVFAIALVTGVMVSSFGLVEATTRGVTLQYGLLYRHDVAISLTEDVTYEEYLDVKGVLASYQLSHNYTELSAQTVQVSGGKGEQSTVLYTVENAVALDKVLYLRQSTWKVYDMPQTGAIVPLKLAETLGLSLGDTITLEGEFGNAEAMVTALSEFYTEQSILMSHAYYERITGTPVEINEFWLCDGAWAEDLQSDLRSLEGVSHLSLRSDEFIQYMGFGLSQPLLYTLVLGAMVLVLLVMGYLNHHNVSGRQVELGTLKVFGLSDYEISAYFYRENIVLTFYGLLLGMVVGQNFHYWFVRTLESPSMMLYRGLSLERFIYGSGVVALVALAVNLWMYHRFQKFEITRALQGMRE